MQQSYLLCLGFCLMGLLLHAQQLPATYLYRYNWSAINPAAVGEGFLRFNRLNEVSCSYRHQWVGVKDAPRQGAASANFIPESLPLIAGINVSYDQAGIFEQSGVYGRIAYRIQGRRNSGLAIGLSAGAVQYAIRATNLNLRQSGDPLLNENVSKIAPDFSLGAFYYQEEKFYAGISIPQIFGLKTQFQLSNSLKESVTRVSHYYALIGAYLGSSDDAIFEPSIRLSYVPNSLIGGDINLRYTLKNSFWMGIGGSGGGSAQLLHADLGVLIGANSNRLDSQLRIGLGYSLTLQQISINTPHTFDINLSCFW